MERLLDWHLGQLDPEERSRIERALHQDAQLAATSDRLGRILQPLDHWAMTPAPLNLADQVLSRLARHRSQETEVEPLPADGARGRSWPFVSIRELLAVAACLILLVGVTLPGVSWLRRGAQRTLCAGNLSSIFRGISTYQETYAGSLPFAGFLPGASWLPEGARGRPYASNSRHIYLLVQLGLVPSPKVFVCPGCAEGKPMPVARVPVSQDFERACNISYASLNMAGSSPNLRPQAPIAYLGDANPLFVNARFCASVDPDLTNSPAHGGRGQTVLTLDGSARWMTTPRYGVRRDNLWLAGNIRRYTGVEAPSDRDDVQLLPGYPVTDPIVGRTLHH